MIKHDLFGEEEVWEMDEAEAREVWKSRPADRWRIWLHAEIDAHLLATPEQLRELIAKKREKPGRLDIVAPPTSVDSSTRCWCQRHMIACSEGEVCGEDCGGWVNTFGLEEEGDD